jgi:hypothetical protein
MLPPLAGEKCVTCGELIASYGEGSFCPQCGNAAHNACQRQDATGVVDGKCARCAGDPQHALAVEVRNEWNRPKTASAEVPVPLSEAAATGVSEFSFAGILVWVLRIMAGACLLILINQIAAIEEAATQAEKADRGKMEFTKEGEPKVSEPVRPSTSGAVLIAVLSTAAAAAGLLALAEILRMQVVILRRLDAPPDEDFTEEGAESEAASPVSQAGHFPEAG